MRGREDIAVGHFTLTGPGSPTGTETSLRDGAVVSMIAFVGGQASLLDGFWVPTEQMLRPGADIVLRRKSGAEVADLVIGRVEQPIRGLALGVARLDGLKYDGRLLWSTEAIVLRGPLRGSLRGPLRISRSVFWSMVLKC